MPLSCVPCLGRRATWPIPFASATPALLLPLRWPPPLRGPNRRLAGTSSRGDRAIRPSGIDDDGAKTYIQWTADSAFPAVYSVDAKGKEALLNGNMRDGIFVIDSVVARLVFRLDKQVARAVRIPQREPRN